MQVLSTHITVCKHTQCHSPTFGQRQVRFCYKFDRSLQGDGRSITQDSDGPV